MQERRLCQVSERLAIILEQRLLKAGRGLEADAVPRFWRGDPATWRAGDEALLHEIGLDHFLNGVARFGQRRSQRVGADGAAAVGFHKRLQVTAVERVKAVFIDFET